MRASWICYVRGSWAAADVGAVLGRPMRSAQQQRQQQQSSVFSVGLVGPKLPTSRLFFQQIRLQAESRSMLRKNSSTLGCKEIKASKYTLSKNISYLRLYHKSCPLVLAPYAPLCTARSEDQRTADRESIAPQNLGLLVIPYIHMIFGVRRRGINRTTAAEPQNVKGKIID